MTRCGPVLVRLLACDFDSRAGKRALAVCVCVPVRAREREMQKRDLRRYNPSPLLSPHAATPHRAAAAATPSPRGVPRA